MTFVDLSHTIAHGTITYPGLPAPSIADHLSREASRERYAPGTTFRIARVEMVGNTGTYIDAPSHRWDDGDDLAAMPLESLADLDGIVVDARQLGRAIGPSAFGAHAVSGRAVLVHTGWSRHFGTPAYGAGHPYLTREAVEALVAAKAKLVGIDSLNIDDTADLSRPVHSLLLAAEVPVVEHLRGLSQLPGSGFRFFAVPVKVKGMGTFPVRAFGLVEESA
jgi:kynurenine formamidase